MAKVTGQERPVARHLRPGKTFSVTAESTRTEPYSITITRLVEVRERRGNRVLGTTEHGESIIVELVTGHVLVWICGGWLGAVGTCGGSEFTAASEAQRMASVRADRDHAERLNRQAGLSKRFWGSSSNGAYTLA